MDKAMRDMWRMKHKAVQKQLNREAWALVRDDWHHARYLQFGVLTSCFVKGWLLAMMMLLLGLGGFCWSCFSWRPNDSTPSLPLWIWRGSCSCVLL